MFSRGLKAVVARTWASVVKPCLTDAYAKLRGEAEAGEISAAVLRTHGSILFFVAITDAAVELAQPLDRALARAQRSYRRMPIADRVLRAGARAKARELGVMRSQQDIDTCDFARRWEATGHSLVELVSLAPSVERFAPDPAVERAMKRLRRLGVSRRDVGDFQAFPLVAVAAPALDGEMLPPTR